MGWVECARGPDVITEWWTNPVATDMGDRTVSGGLGSTGVVQAVEIDHATGEVVLVPVAFAGQDDHNAPALWAAPGRRMVLAWTEHGHDTLLKVRVSDTSGSVQSLPAAPTSTVDIGDPTSYAIVHRIEHLSSTLTDVFWVFVRATGASWRFVPVSVTQATGAVTFGAVVPLVTALAQSYLSVADAHGVGSHQVLRMAWGYSSHVGYHGMRYFEVDVVTGEVVSPMDGGAVIANVLTGAGLPVLDTATTPLIPEPDAGFSRWMFAVRPGPFAPGIAYADWDMATPDLAVYRIVTLSGGARTIEDYGPAGPRFGYTDGSNYLASLSFPDPCPQDVVAIAAQIDGVDSVRVVRTDQGDQFTSTVLTSTTNRLIRPVWPRGTTTRLHVSRIDHYGAVYTDYAATLIALVDATTPTVTVTADRTIRIIAGELRTGAILDQRLPVTENTTWEVIHRAAGTISASIPLLSADVTRRPGLLRFLDPARCFLGVAVGDTLLEAGPIWAHDMPDQASGLLTVKALGLPSLFDRRVVMGVLTSGWAAWEQSYTGSLGTIAKRLIEQALAHTGGDLPLDLPDDESGTAERTEDGFDLASVWDLVVDIMDVVNGPDIDMPPRFVGGGESVRWQMRTGTTADPLLHQDGPDWVWDAGAVRGSVTGVSVQVDGSKLTTRAWATGEGTDTALLIRRAQDDALTDAGLPLLESVSGYPTVKKFATLQAHADADLRAGMRPEMTWGLTADANASPLLGTYRPGDYATVWTPPDHPYLRHLYPAGNYRTRIAGFSGGMGRRVRVSLMPTIGG